MPETPETNDALLTEVSIGALSLPNRVVMAPLTRSRAKQPGDVPTALNAEYYSQRATMGLIVTEATYVSPMGKGYGMVPGIATDEQVEGWRLVTDAVHAAGGRIFLQLWHSGRISHPDLLPEGVDTPVAPSAIKAESETYTADGRAPVAEPRALEVSEIPGLIEEWRVAAANAKRAGFDGAEIHGANGYLIDQFLRDGSNTRTDEWGGSIEKRCRFALEVADAVAGEFGADRVGFRVSPTGDFNTMHDSDPVATFSHLATALGERGLAYLHVVEQFGGGPTHELAGVVPGKLRSAFDGAYIANGDYTPDRARDAVASGRADLVAFGRPAIANPDLVERIRLRAPLAEADPATFYGGTEAGYTDYPTLETQNA